MWLIKLPFRIIALPIMAVVAVLSIFYSIALHLSSLIVSFGFLLFGVAVVVFLGLMLAELISIGLEALVGKLSKFIFS